MIQFNSLQQHKVHYKNYLLLLVLCLITFWPLTFGIFSVKNDAIHYFLPFRFQVSEAIQNGEWPFWSPYLYLGYPIMGDMQSGAWNPVVWLISVFTRYDVTVFHFETLFYIFLAGVGMYKLINQLYRHSQTALLIGASYMLSGFLVSGQLINWLAAAAFLPFVIHYYLLTTRTLAFTAAIKTGITLFFLLTAGYPSFFIITGYLLLLLFIIKVADIYRGRYDIRGKGKKFFLLHILIIFVFLGLSAPALVSFFDLLPYYTRGSVVSYSAALTNTFEAKHLLSLVFPSYIQANDITTSTDITCRNVYIGIFTLVMLAAIRIPFHRRNILLIILAVGALLFSLGDATPIRKFSYDFIPLMDKFRHPSQMRLFLVFALLVLASGNVQKLLNNELSATAIRRLRFVTWSAVIAIAITTAIFFSLPVTTSSIGDTTSSIKNILENLSLANVITLNGIMQVIFLVGLGMWLHRFLNKKHWLTFLWLLNLFLLAQLILPATFVSKLSPREINSLIHASPKGFPTIGLEKTLSENSTDAFSHFDKIGLSYFYNKKIGISRITNNPSFLKEQELFLESGLVPYIASLPVLYIADSAISIKDTVVLNRGSVCKYAIIDPPDIKLGPCHTIDTVKLYKLTSNSFHVETETCDPALLVLTQNYHHHWKVLVDGKQGTIMKTNTSFMGTLVAAGKHRVIFKFVPGNTQRAMWIMAFTFLVIISLFIVSIKRQFQRKSFPHS